VNRHQRVDKGFGPALGPDAVVRAEECFGALGYHTRRADSTWILTPEHDRLQRLLVAGWANAARAIAAGGGMAGEAGTIDAWESRRLAHIASGRSRMEVGHQDLAGWPRSGRGE
jgi:hypothetical protein